MDMSDLREHLLRLYLRLNGFFTSDFIVHSSETAKNKTVVWQSDFMSRWRRARNLSFRVIDLITVWQMHDLFSVKWLLFERHNGLVSNDVVNEIGAHRARITEIAHLDGAGPSGEDAGARIRGETIQIDGDIDLQAADKLRDLLVALLANIDEAVK